MSCSSKATHSYKGPAGKDFQCQIVNIFLSICFNISWFVLGAQKNRLIEMVLSSTSNICFGWEKKMITHAYQAAFSL